MRNRLRLAVVLGALALAACDDGNDVTPTIITGGGVSSGGIDGEANVYAIEADSDEPISGAMVYVGTVSGETDETGLFVATGVSGAQTITVIADGFITQTWVGVNGANVTIPLDLEDDATPDVPQATVTGTINGFTDLEVPASGAKAAFVTYSANNEDDDPANEIAQPGGGAGIPPNVCFNAGGPNPTCEWSLITRTGPQAIVAFIGDFDLANETIMFDGFAYATGLDVQDGVDQDGVELELADDNEVVTADLELPDPPSGTTEVQALVRVNLGEDGRLQIPATGDFVPPVPALSVFDGSDYDVLAVATDADEENQSIRFDRDVDSVDGYTVTDFIDLPDGVAVDDRVFSSDVHPDATAHIFDIENEDGETQWAIAFFDGTAAITQPEEVNLPSGALVLRAQAFVVPEVDFTDFVLEDLIDSVTAVSASQIDFTN